MELPRAPALLDETLDLWQDALGPDRTAYRNHCHRVFAFSRLLAPKLDADTLALTAAFHDLGIWSDRTFDYLGPSARRAAEHLTRIGRASLAEAVTRAIEGHHKLTRIRAEPVGLAEGFRRADWVDVTFGLRRFNLPRAVVRAAFASWPDAGFHRKLVALGWRRFWRHPLSPLPMLRW